MIMENNHNNNTYNTLNKNKTLFFILGVTIVILLFFLLEFTFHRRKSKKMKNYKLDKINKNYIPLPNCHQMKYTNIKPKLNEYYISSSFNSLLIGNQKRDYLSLEMLKKVLISGARYIEFQINPNNFSDIPLPLVGTGERQGNWSYSLNTFPLEKVLNIIKEYAFISFSYC